MADRASGSAAAMSRSPDENLNGQIGVRQLAAVDATLAK